MKDYKVEFEVDGKKYAMVFNLNVMQEIQKKYGSLQEWTKLLEGNNDEPDCEAIIYGLGSMINEWIDINNEENNLSNPMLSEKQIGRLITKIGFENSTTVLKNTIIESTKEEKPKNE